MQVNFSVHSPPPDERLVPQTWENRSQPVAEDRGDPAGPEPDKAEKMRVLQNVLAENHISLNFRRDEQNGQLIVELIDDKTGEAVRQIPSEVSVELSKVFAKIQGQFIDEQV